MTGQREGWIGNELLSVTVTSNVSFVLVVSSSILVLVLVLVTGTTSVILSPRQGYLS